MAGTTRAPLWTPADWRAVTHRDTNFDVGHIVAQTATVGEARRIEPRMVPIEHRIFGLGRRRGANPAPYAFWFMHVAGGTAVFSRSISAVEPFALTFGMPVRNAVPRSVVAEHSCLQP